MVICDGSSTGLEKLCRSPAGHNRTHFCEPIIHREPIRRQVRTKAVKSSLLRRKTFQKRLRDSGLAKQRLIGPTRVPVSTLEQERQIRILTRTEPRIQLVRLRPEIQAQAR